MPAPPIISPSRSISNCCSPCSGSGSARPGAAAPRRARGSSRPRRNKQMSAARLVPSPTAAGFEPVPEAEPAPLRRARVLVVDDDEHNLLAIRTVIEDLADVEVAASGEEA